MVPYLLIVAIVILLCVLLNRLTHRLGVPMLLAFIMLGMLFGEDGLLNISFDNYRLSEDVCTLALIFIMFYGGFGTNWAQARPVAVKALLLSTGGVMLTAALTGFFCVLALGMDLWEGLLLGALLSSTDAASVFAVLRSKKLGLKENTASMLEVESGSNDPFSYMLTAILLSVMKGNASGGALLSLILAQLFFAILLGVAIALLSRWFLLHYHFDTPGFDMATVLGIALLSYALPTIVGGNGFLSAYIVGIVLGNVKIKNKRSLVHFFDGVTGLMQMLIFFVLGLLATPSRILPILLSALLISVFLTLVARPLAVFACLSPLRCSLRQQMLVSFAGLRGAASVVFAIMAVVSGVETNSDFFHIVFCVVLISITVQGSLLAPAARRLSMCDRDVDDAKSFSDYSDEVDLHFIELVLAPEHPWTGKKLRDLRLPPDLLIVMLLREGKSILPSGSTGLAAGDHVIISAPAYAGEKSLLLTERRIDAHSEWIGHPISECSPSEDELVVAILRGAGTVIPRGDTRIEVGDVLVLSVRTDGM